MLMLYKLVFHKKRDPRVVFCARIVLQIAELQRHNLQACYDGYLLVPSQIAFLSSWRSVDIL